MNYVASGMVFAGLALVVTGLMLTITHRLPQYQASGVMAIGSALLSIGGSLGGSLPVINAFNAACAAFHAWCWWNGGGGDGTGRRLREVADRFRPVRRTAPQGAA